ncbi:MAG: LPS translocon maturation chaperone LptM [Gammaproteobacteria bacterium]
MLRKLLAGMLGCGLLGALAACGQKGPLYLPVTPPRTIPAMPPRTTHAAPRAVTRSAPATTRVAAPPAKYS